MQRFWAASAGATALVLLAMGATLATTLGASLWHHNVAYAALVAGAAAAWPWLRHRRFATMTMLYALVAATATGFVMLYTKDFPYKDWVTWWHGVTSVAFLLAFLVHWLHNRTRLGIFAGRLARADRAWGALVLALGIVVAAAFAWTWGTDARLAFTRENYLYLSSWAVFVGVGVPYGLWLAFRHRAWRARLARTAERNRARAVVDASLFAANWLALATGLVLLYFAASLHAGPWKYVSKWWHTATSVALLSLLALHVGFNARLLAAHARRLGGRAMDGDGGDL